MGLTKAQLLTTLAPEDHKHIYEHDANHVFVRGCELAKHAGSFPLYAVRQTTYSRAAIIAKIQAGEGSMASAVFTILNQGSYPWCWAFSSTQALMVLLHQLYGEKVVLDPSLGPAITGVRGGNAIDAMLQEVQIPYGALPAGYLGDDPTQSVVNIRRSTWPSDWKTVAAKRRAIDGDYLQCNDLLTAASSILNQHPGVIGVDWQGGGHALCCAEVGYESGRLYLAGPNSWGLEFDSGWGSYPNRPGWWKLAEDQLDAAWDDFGYYALCGARDESVTAPPAPSA